MRLALAAIVAAFAMPAVAQAEPNCAALTRIVMPGAEDVRATSVPAGALSLPAGSAPSPGMNLAGQAILPANPAFCRIALTLRPSPASSIHTEVWLPAKWNGKFLGVGNFGWGGSLPLGNMAAGLSRGYAVAGNDTGHQANSADQGGAFALGQPDRLIDYAYRANHAMTMAAKAIVRRAYGRAPVRSYWIGCSLGGLQGLIEAKRYPADYDGIVAGAPPNPLVRFNAAQLWPGWLLAQDPARLISKEGYAAIHAAVLATCPSTDGAVDHPERCGFDPESLSCRPGGNADCLTAPQVAFVREIYRGPVDPLTQAVIFPGPAKGSELEWWPFVSGEPFVNALDLFRYAAFQDQAWTAARMDWARGPAAAQRALGPILAVDDDLTPFFRRGGLLLLYIGWNDYHNPAELIAYRDRLARRLGGKADNHVRVFAIPGMNHCAGGPGCDTFDKLGILDAWVTRGLAPVTITAAHSDGGRVTRTRTISAAAL